MNVTDQQAKIRLAANVRRLMDLHGLNQSQLAAAAGENRMLICRVLAGEHNTGIATVTRIAQALEVSVDELLKPIRKNFSRKSEKVVF